jgi:acyl-CoA reductase-like NAD-dependent aldehyde dehydrogenase
MTKLRVSAPFDQSEIKEVQLHTYEEAENKLNIAREIFDNRKNWIPTYQRIAILEKLVEMMKDEEEELIITASSEGGKPYQDSKIEISRAILGIKIAIKEMGNMHGEQIPMGITPSSTQRLAFTMREPIGVVFAISAFNHPVNLIVHQVVTAFATGCPVIVKPASSTPLSCLKICEMMHQAGVPEEWVQPLICDNDVAEKVSSDPRINYLSFIGSSKVGWYLKSKMAPGTRCGLEHGGVAPVIIEPDIYMEDIIEPLCKGAFYHAGQVCVSVQRVFAHEKIARKLAEKMAKRAAQLKVGNPIDKATEVGPIITKKELERIHHWVLSAIEGGAEILTGGKIVHDTCYLPTVLWNPPMDSKVCQEEIFGPVVAIIPYQDIDEAIANANRINYHFQAAVFTENLNTAFKCIQELNASAVMVNDHTAFRVDWMPFGGRNESGEGLGGIPFTMKELTQTKLMVFKSQSIVN